MKTCSTCGDTKEYSDFVRSPKHRDGYHGVCKPCRNAQRRGRRSTTPEQHRKYALKALYGITVEEYDRLYEKQNGCCAICNTPEFLSTRKRLVVDHCHESGEVRALLCHHCNTGLGAFNDNPAFLKAAQSYLEGY